MFQKLGKKVEYILYFGSVPVTAEVYFNNMQEVYYGTEAQTFNNVSQMLKSTWTFVDQNAYHPKSWMVKKLNRFWGTSFLTIERLVKRKC